MAHGVEEAVDTAVLQHAGRVGGLDAFGLEVFFDIDAGGFKNVNGILAVAGAGVADVDDLALGVLQALDAGIFGGDESDGFGSQREHGAEVLLGLAFPFGKPVVGLILAVGLRDAEFKIARHDGVDVEYGRAGGFDGGPDVVLVLLGVDDLGDGAAGGVVDAGDAAGADGNERRLGVGFKGGSARHGHGKAENSREQMFVHVVVSLLSTFSCQLYEEGLQSKGGFHGFRYIGSVHFCETCRFLPGWEPFRGYGTMVPEKLTGCFLCRNTLIFYYHFLL